MSGLNTRKITYVDQLNYRTLWPPLSSGTTLGLTAKGDLLGFDGSNAGPLHVGSNNTALIADSSQTYNAKWSALTSGTILGMSAKGDTLYHNGTNAAPLAVGSNYQALLVDSTQPLGVKYAGFDYKKGVATTTQSLTNNTMTDIVFGNVTGSLNLASLPAGLYTAFLQICWTGNTTGSRYAHIFLDSTSISTAENQSSNASFFLTQVCTATFTATAGQALTFKAKQTSGGALSLTNAPDLATMGLQYWVIRLPS